MSPYKLVDYVCPSDGRACDVPNPVCGSYKYQVLLDVIPLYGNKRKCPRWKAKPKR